MSFSHQVVMGLAKVLTRAVCRVDDAALARVPARGPLILVGNHINFLEVPLVYTHLLPRPLTGLVKAESFQGPLGFFFKLGNGIPVHRGEGDAAAFRKSLAALAAGQILAIAPEGTRTNDGRLRAGHPGVALLALRSGAPVQPIVYWGSEAFWPNLRRLKRTDFHIAVGPVLRVEAGAGPVTQAVRQAITDEIMIQLAALLPPAYRGVYAGRLGEPRRYLQPAAAGAETPGV
jgi:1-acyl-sn-glycerol-3-phosphate acyltransferase